MNIDNVPTPTVKRVEGLGQVDVERYVFFPVSVSKLIVMYAVTLGAYQLYWFYKNWTVIKEREQRDLIPALRSIFSIIFCYQCFGRIEDGAKAQGIKAKFPAGLLAVIFILGSLIANLPEPYWLLTLILCIGALVPVQILANSVNSLVTPEHDENGSYSGWNITSIIVGGIFLLLVIIGSFLPADVWST
jgi:hypothetical protein